MALAATDAAAPLNVSVKGSELKLNGTLPAHASASFAVLLPAQRTDLSALPAPARLRAETEAYWNAVLAPAMQVQTPDPLLNNVIRSSQVRCLIAARNEADGARVAPWIAAMSYGPLESEAHSVIRGMDFMGHGEFAGAGWTTSSTAITPTASSQPATRLSARRGTSGRWASITSSIATPTGCGTVSATESRMRDEHEWIAAEPGPGASQATRLLRLGTAALRNTASCHPA